MTFVRAEERRYPVGKQNSTDKVLEDCEAAKQSIFDRFMESFDIDGLPGWSLDEISGGLQDAFQAVWDVVGPLQSEMTYYDNLIRQYLLGSTDSFYSIVDSITGMVGSIMRVPQYLDSLAAISVFGALRDLWQRLPSTDTAAAYSNSGILLTSGTKPADVLVASDSPYQTETREKTAQAMDDLSSLFEGVATVSAVEAVAGIELDNYEEAVSLREDFNQQFTGLLKRGVGEHSTMLRLHTNVLKDLRERSRDLARVMAYTPQSYQPVIYISYRLFGTIHYASEIMAMNPHITNPLLVPPGIPLRIVRRES